jgi:hypothetical protein
METVVDMIVRGAEQLLQRANGPLQFRLVVMPTVVTLVAIRAGLKDGREGQPAFLWSLIAQPAKRRQRLVAAWKDISRIFCHGRRDGCRLPAYGAADVLCRADSDRRRDLRCCAIRAVSWSSQSPGTGVVRNMGGSSTRSAWQDPGRQRNATGKPGTL